MFLFGLKLKTLNNHVFCSQPFSLVQLAIEHHNAKTQSSMRQRRASESDSMVERPTENMGPTDPQQVDIIQMLSKAQHEYVKVGGCQDGWCCVIV